MMAALATTVLVGCDASTDLASAGDTGPNPGVPLPPPPPPTSPPASPPPPPAACPEFATETTVGSETHCALDAGVITDNITLTADTTWQLNGVVFIGEDTGANGNGGDPAILTIEPGTTIYGRDAQSALIISRGSRIEAEGTRFEPIVMTSAEDLGYADELGRTGRAAWSGLIAEDPNTGEWGGLIINGRAPINNGTAVAGGGFERQGEVDSGLFGGNNPTDNSGTLRFVQVRYPGYRESPTDELNGIAFQGVGSGTVVEYVHVHGSSDDAFEWFGGTVNGRYLVATATGDDSFDWTDGWQGRVQFGLVIQSGANPEVNDDSRGIEGDNLGANADTLPRSQPKFANVTMVGAATGDTGMLLRRGTAGEFYNFVIAGFPDASLDLDTAETYAQYAAGNLVLNSVLLDNVTPSSALETDEDDANLQTLFLAGAGNRLGTTSLQQALGGAYVNGSAEQDIPAADLSGDSFFVQVPFAGAVNSADYDDASADPDYLQNWTQGFTFLLSDPDNVPEAACPDVEGVTPRAAAPADGICTLAAGVYVEDMTFMTGLEYHVDGQIFIGNDVGADGAAADAAAVNLTIQPGVTVRGMTGETSIVITRGSRLIANGTAAQPITFAPAGLDFTVPANLNSYGNNAAPSWGGLVINGRAPINNGQTAADGSLERTGEGSSGLFGGSLPDDSSGAMRYVRVLNAGFRQNSGDELNGIAFQGVGRGTEVEYLQIHNAQDDGIEWFGGTVDVRHLVITGAGDDSMDWTDGWQGRVQHAVVVQNPDNSETNDDSRGIEADNFGSNADAAPRSNPILSNVTLIGTSTGDSGMVLRRGTAGHYYNFVVTGFPDAQLDVDTAQTFQQITEGNLVLRSMLLGNAVGAPLETDSDDADATTLADAFNAAGSNNVIAATTLAAPANGGKAFVNGTAEAAVTATDASAVDSFFEATSHIGAVPSTEGNWTAGWTVWLNQP
ncbi:hypothetical protein [Indioceanicola profundi]|uniref:hypothetical protein n=1 Tax=Indioceanicola profundi TaxID=2220096 RepID=UPI000E6AA4E3|nr:hypothetical protein [Indioceanicola profundi]